MKRGRLKGLKGHSNRSHDMGYPIGRLKKVWILRKTTCDDRLMINLLASEDPYVKRSNSKALTERHTE